MTAVLVGFGMKTWYRIGLHPRLEPSRQGALLKNRLVEDAAIYRELLDNAKRMDPDNGVEYFSQLPSRILLEGHAECIPLIPLQIPQFLQSSPR